MGFIEPVDQTYQVRFAIPPFKTYTIVAQGLAANADYPKTNVQDLDQDTEFRTTATGGSADPLYLDLATAEDVILYLYGTNFKDFEIYGSNTQGSGYSLIATLECQKDTAIGIRKGWWVLSPWVHRYMQLKVTGATDSGATYYGIKELILAKLSTVISPSGGHTLPLVRTPFRPNKAFEYDTGGRGIVNLGRRRIRVLWGGQAQPIDDEEGMGQVVQLDENQKFLFIENLRTPTNPVRTTDTSRVELVTRVGEFTFTIDGQVYETGMVLEEA